jgi:integrase
MPLSDVAIKAAKPGKKAVKLSDGSGMYVEITPAGQKWWRLKYRFGGRERRISLGVYPEVSLKVARERRDAARKQLADGIDPSTARKAQRFAQVERCANSFDLVAREWFDKYSATWVEGHKKRVLSLLERDVFPWIGARPIAEITSPELLTTIRRIENRGAVETARRALRTCSQVFMYSIAIGRATNDPSSPLRGALTPVKNGHFAAVTEPKPLGTLLRVLDGYKGTLVVRCALQLAPLLFVRPGELRKARWADFDLNAGEWRFQITKTDTPHIVPLSRQAVEILQELHPLTGKGSFVFPSARSATRPMSDNAILAAMRRMNIGKDEMTGHGFRAAARTILDEVLKVRPDFIEHQLAHAVRDPNGRAYNRTAFLVERRIMMQQWADYLGQLKEESPA